MLWMMTLEPFVENLSVRSWARVPCTIVQSRVESGTGGRRRAYSVQVQYRYQYEGQTYLQDWKGPTSRRSKRKTHEAKRIISGDTWACYVNPAAPSQARLDRTAKPRFWLGLFYSVPFLALATLPLFRRAPQSGEPHTQVE